MSKNIIVGGLLTAILLGALGPTMMAQLYQFTSHSNVTGTSVGTIAGLFPLFIVLAIALVVFRKVKA